MQFLLKQEFYLYLTEDLTEEIIDKEYFLDDAESRSIEMIKNYLRPVFDIDFEFRKYQDFQHSVTYQIDDRIRIIENLDNNSFGTSSNIELIDINADADSEYILVKKSENEFQYLLSNKETDFNIDDRNKTLVDWLTDLTKYNLLKRVSPHKMNQATLDSHDLVLEQLTKAAKGLIQLNLKKLETTEETKQKYNSIIFVDNIYTKNIRY